MTTRRTILFASAGAMLVAGAAFAQNAASNGGMMQFMHHHQPPSPETMQRLLEGRIAMIKATLQLTPDQEKLWPAVEQAMRDNAAARAKAMADHVAAMNQNGSQDAGQAPPPAKPDPVAELEKMSKMASDHAAAAQKLADALKPLYATFTDAQKAVAMLILEPHGGMGHGGRHGHMMRG